MAVLTPALIIGREPCPRLHCCRSRVLWPAHLYGREQPYCQLEKLANLGALPGAVGFTVACFPIKLAGLGAGWTRVVAIVEAD